jgi:hypothetical protein
LRPGKNLNGMFGFPRYLPDFVEHFDGDPFKDAVLGIIIRDGFLGDIPERRFLGSGSSSLKTYAYKTDNQKKDADHCSLL